MSLALMPQIFFNLSPYNRGAWTILPYPPVHIQSVSLGRIPLGALWVVIFDAILAVDLRFHWSFLQILVVEFTRRKLFIVQGSIHFDMIGQPFSGLLHLPLHCLIKSVTFQSQRASDYAKRSDGVRELELQVWSYDVEDVLQVFVCMHFEGTPGWVVSFFLFSGFSLNARSATVDERM